MALISFILLSLVSAAQANPLWGLARRQQELCGNPDISTAASLVVPGAQGDVTFTPSQVADTALWTLTTPTAISETETIYPFGYVWVASEPVTLEVPALPTTAVPYPLPEGALATLCNGAQILANNSAIAPTTDAFVTPTSLTTIAPVISSTFTDIVEEPSTPTTPVTPEEPTSVPPVISSTFTDVGQPNTPTTPQDTTTLVPPVVSSTYTDIVEGPNTPTTPTAEDTATAGETTTAQETTEAETTTGGTTSVQETTPGETTVADTTTVQDTTTAQGTTTAQDTTPGETTTDETTSEETTAETTAAGETTTAEETTTAAEETTTAVEETTTTADGATTTQAADGTTGFPDYDPPTTTVSGPEATDDAIDAGPILFALWSNRDMVQDDEKKDEYIRKSEDTRDDILILWANFDIKPDIPTECGETALAKRSLISGILDVLDDAAKLIGCATKVVTNLVDNVKLPVPPIDIIITLTDTLKEISEELEKEKEKETDQPTETDEVSSTEGPTTTATSCAETGVESCTQTVYLSTSFYKDGDVDTSTVETVTTEDCVTITQCDAQATTEVTTVTTVTSTSISELICDVDCTKCNVERRWAEPTSTPQDGGGLFRRLDNMNQAKYDTDEKKDGYVLRQISEGANKLNWNTITTNVVSIDGEWGENPFGLSVEGLVGCTGVTIASDRGGWLAHFMEPGFFYDSNKPADDAANNGRKDLWDGMMNQLRDAEGTTISDKFTPPSRLAVEGGILASDSNVQIFVSVPRMPETSFDNPTYRYPDRVAELINILTGENGAFQGVEVITKTYVKPPAEETDAEIDARLKTARGIMFIEYDDFQENWETGEYSDPPDTMWRVWQERSYYERRMTHTVEATPSCSKHADEAAGMDPSTANALAKKFCEDSGIAFDADAELQLGGGDLDPAQTLAADIKFNFEKKDGECAKTCTEAYEQMIHSCQYNSHLYTGQAELDLGCGKYSMDTIKLDEPEPEPTAPPEVNNCADPTVYTKFSLSQVQEAIADFCSHEIVLPTAAQPIFKTYKMAGVTLQLITQWTTTGLQGCNEPADGAYIPQVAQSDCEARFTGAVNNCNVDTTDDKYGQRPYVWNSPNGCIDFWIYGDAEDWDCEGLGVQPVPCQDAGQKLD